MAELKDLNVVLDSVKSMLEENFNVKVYIFAYPKKEVKEEKQ